MESRTTTSEPRRRRRREKRTSVSYATSSSHPNTNETTTPAYPALLSVTTIGSDKTLEPAAFPSLPFKRPYSGSKDCLKDSAPSKRGRFSVEPRPLASLGQQHDRFRQDFDPLKKSSEATEAEDVALGSEGLLDQAVIDDMQTSSILAPVDLHIHEEPQISWNRIELGLQLYIFDNLTQQFQQPRIVADILGLNSNDLRTLAHVRNRRVLQPETTEDLWDYCRLLGDETKAFVDPRILKGHLDYFAYISQFEGISAIQRRTALVFLRQRQIEGAFVEALLQEESGIWPRPDYEEEDHLHNATDLSMFTQDDEAEWPSALAKIFVHHSHDLDMIAHHFRSCYLPSTIRNGLLTKPVQDLNALELWLMYASTLPDTTFSELGEEQLDSDSPRLGSSTDPVLCGLLMALGYQAQEGDDSVRISADDSVMIHSILYTIARAIHQSRILRQNIEQMPLTRQQKFRVLEVAEEHQKLMLVEQLRFLSQETPEQNSTDVSKPASIPSEDSTPLTRRTISPQSTAYGSFAIDPISSSSPGLGQGYSSATSPEPAHTDHAPEEGAISSWRADKNQRDTLSTNATLVLTNQKPRYRTCDALNNENAGELPRHDVDRRIRALSQESYHTAPDYEGNDAEVSIVPREAMRRTPSPPPWSPLTEVDEETHEVNNSSSQIFAPGNAITGLGLNTIDGQAVFEKATTYNGDMPGSQSSPTVGNCGQAGQPSDVSMSKPPSKVLYDIHEAATSPAPSPTAQSNSKAISTNAERQPSLSKRPLPSPDPQHDHTSPFEPPKKKRKTTAKPQATDQPSPEKSKVNLKLRIPTRASASSSESSSASPKTSSPSPKKTRCDKGKKRGPYNTKKNRLAMQLKAEAAAKEIQTQAEPDREAIGSEKKENSTSDHSNASSVSSMDVNQAAGSEERGLLLMTNDGQIVVQKSTDSEY